MCCVKTWMPPTVKTVSNGQQKPEHPWKVLSQALAQHIVKFDIFRVKILHRVEKDRKKLLARYTGTRSEILSGKQNCSSLSAKSSNNVKIPTTGPREQFGESVVLTASRSSLYDVRRHKRPTASRAHSKHGTRRCLEIALGPPLP